MHATYYFLTELDLSWEEGDALTQAQDRFIDYATYHCDENNWWEIESVVLYDDRKAERGHPLGAHSGCWAATWLEATWAVVCEFKWFLPEDYAKSELPGLHPQADLSHPALAEVICAEIPAFLAWAYGQMQNSKPGRGASLDNYRRARIATAYELFLTSDEPDRYPFTDAIRSPYDYRAYDLSREDSANAIIRVDIHT